MTAPAFSRRRATGLALAAVASLAAGGVLGVFGDELSEPRSVDPDSFSRSAIGHGALLELLRDRGMAVLVSRHRTAEKAADGAVVVLAEPALGTEPDDPRAGDLKEIVSRARRLLVVLPKRGGTAHPQRRRWLGAESPLPPGRAERVLEILGIDAQLVRAKHVTPLSTTALPAPELLAPQLVRSSEIVPLVAYAEGILAGEIVDARTGTRIVLLADPDVVANHGLARGHNAALAVRLLERLGAGAAPLVLDETLHGHALRPSVARELFRFPLALAAAQALLVAALAVWAGLVRFGRASPAGALLAPGKSFLVENTASLLRHGGHVPHALRAYLASAKDELARRLRGPGDRAGARDAWVARFAAARGRADALAVLEARVRSLSESRRGVEEEALRTARDIHAWREEMTHGAERDTRPHRPAAG